MGEQPADTKAVCRFCLTDRLLPGQLHGQYLWPTVWSQWSAIMFRSVASSVDSYEVSSVVSTVVSSVLNSVVSYMVSSMVSSVASSQGSSAPSSDISGSTTCC